MRLRDKVAVVTGATRGIGRAIAKRFAIEGANVIVTGRSAEAGNAVLQEIEEGGAAAVFLRADLTREADVRDLMSQTLDRFGRLDVLVNGAAATDVVTRQDGAVHMITTEAWEAILHGAATVTYRCCKYAIPGMIGSGGGSIVNLSTAVASRGGAGFAAHSASKAAVEALTRSIAVECAQHNIRANSLGLGFILSSPEHEAMADHPVAGPAIRATHLLRLGRLEDVASAALFLASDESGFITGVGLPVDGGATCRMPVTGVRAVD